MQSSVIDHRWSQNVARTKKKWHAIHRASVSLVSLPHFDVVGDLLLDRCMEIRNLSVLYDKETIDHKKESIRCENNLTYCITQMNDHSSLPVSLDVVAERSNMQASCTKNTHSMWKAYSSREEQRTENKNNVASCFIDSYLLFNVDYYFLAF